MPRCMYRDCRNNTKYKIWGETIKYIPIPKPITNKYLTQKWLHLCGKGDFSLSLISRNSYVCSKHFVGGRGPTAKYPDPVAYNTAGFEEVQYTYTYDDIAREEIIDSTTETDEILLPQEIVGPTVSRVPEHNYAKVLTTTSKNEMVQEQHSIKVQKVPKRTCAKNLFHTIANKQMSYQTKSDILISYNTLSAKKERFKFFTGISHEHFLVLYNLLDPSIMKTLKYKYKQGTPKKCRILKVNEKDKLCITLIRLRRGYTYKELGFLFGVSESWIASIVYTWIQFIYLQTIGFRVPLFENSRSIPRKEIPKCYRPFTGLTLVLDATEVKIQMPRNYERQGNTHSSYKHANTVKFLIGTNVHGMITYVSEGYEGSISDRQIFSDCDIKTFLKENDIIMADRGFNIHDILDELHMKLIIPPFLLGRDKLTAEEEVLTKNIAKARIHVERAIERIKKFRVLSNEIPILQLPILSAMFYVAAFLVNFQERLVK